MKAGLTNKLDGTILDPRQGWPNCKADGSPLRGISGMHGEIASVPAGWLRRTSSHLSKTGDFSHIGQVS